MDLNKLARVERDKRRIPAKIWNARPYRTYAARDMDILDREDPST
jgi:hypothetical protein